MFEAIFDQERSGKNLSQSTRGSLISGMKSSNERPGTWSRFAKNDDEPINQGFLNLSSEIEKNELPGTGVGKKMKIKLK